MYLETVKRNALTISRLIAAVSTILLLTYLADAISQESSETGFILVDSEVKGGFFGITSAILFIAAFVLEFRERSMITSVLLISSGALMGTLAIANDALSDLGIAEIATSFANAASVGYIIMGLGILHLVKLRESRG